MFRPISDLVHILPEGVCLRVTCFFVVIKGCSSFNTKFVWILIRCHVPILGEMERSNDFLCDTLLRADSWWSWVLEQLELWHSILWGCLVTLNAETTCCLTQVISWWLNKVTTPFSCDWQIYISASCLYVFKFYRFNVEYNSTAFSAVISTMSSSKRHVILQSCI